MNNQIFYTVLSGTLIFVLGQIIQNFILDPIYKYKKVVGKIDNKLKYYANILTNSLIAEKYLITITNVMRRLSCDLETSYKQIPFNKLFVLAKVVQSKKRISDSARGLIFLSNAGGRGDARIDKCDETIDKIRENLQIENL